MPSNSTGKAVIFSAPSGSGKTTIVRRLLEDAQLNLAFSVSATTRPPRGKEVHGHDYYFLSSDEFNAQIASGGLVEWEEVYPGKFYGTLTSELNRLWDAGKTVVFDVDVVGGANLREKLGERALAIFIQAPSLDVLRERLERRGTKRQLASKNGWQKLSGRCVSKESLTECWSTINWMTLALRQRNGSMLTPKRLPCYDFRRSDQNWPVFRHI